MKKMILGGLLISLTLLGADCQINTDTDNEKNTVADQQADKQTDSLQVTSDGLEYEEAYLTVNNQKVTTSEFSLGTEISMNFDGVENFEEINGMVFPGAMLVVADKNGKEIKEVDDMFTQYEKTGVAVDDARDIFVNLKIGDDMPTGNNYTWYVKIWDKKGKGKIEATLDLTVK